jgi:transglutaminase-like putative cysteine protease
MGQQRYELRYQAIFSGAAEGQTTVYVPFPPDNAAQTVERFELSSELPGGRLVSWSLEREAEYGNRFIRAIVENAPGEGELIFHYVITRRELSNPLTSPPPAALASKPSVRLLQPDRLVPLGEPIASLARETVSRATTADARIKAIYEKTVGLMRYDKTGTGWGQGNVVFACDEKRGNCTDFHSMIIGMARASGVAGRFEIGVSLPVDKTEGEVAGYHCWAYLFHPRRGWVPMDASEGWKQERRYKDYYRRGATRTTTWGASARTASPFPSAVISSSGSRASR